MRRGWGLALAAVLCLGAQAQQVSLVFAGDTTPPSAPTRACCLCCGATWTG